MPNEPLTITLTPEMSDRIRAKVADHGYASPLDVIQEGLYALDHNDDGFEPWMRQELWTLAMNSTGILRRW